jgi:hypothetical protein
VLEGLDWLEMGSEEGDVNLLFLAASAPPMGWATSIFFRPMPTLTAQGSPVSDAMKYCVRSRNVED